MDYIVNAWCAFLYFEWTEFKCSQCCKYKHNVNNNNNNPQQQKVNEDTDDDTDDDDGDDTTLQLVSSNDSNDIHAL